MIVTITTDASYSHRHKMGAFAFWIVSNQGRLCQSGPLRTGCTRPQIAEFRCIINAVHALGRLGWKDITKVIINTDCMDVIHLVNNDSANIQKYRLLEWSGDLVKMFNRTYKSTGIGAPIVMRHVKSHVSTETARQWVNEWCDQAAKKALSEMIKK
jgi:ribonuclease HI